MTNVAAATRTEAAATRMPRCTFPTEPSHTTRLRGDEASYKNRAGRNDWERQCKQSEGFPKAKYRSAVRKLSRVVLDGDAVIHLIDAQDLRVAAVAAQLVVFAHDQGLDRLGRADLGAQSAEAAARQIEVEVVEHLDLL